MVKSIIFLRVIKCISYVKEDRAEIRKQSNLENAIKALVDMSIISIILVIADGIMMLLDNKVMIKVKIGLIIIGVIAILKVIYGIFNYFKINRKLDKTNEEKEKEKASLIKKINDKKNQL